MADKCRKCGWEVSESDKFCPNPLCRAEDPWRWELDYGISTMESVKYAGEAHWERVVKKSNQIKSTQQYMSSPGHRDFQNAHNEAMKHLSNEKRKEEWERKERKKLAWQKQKTQGCGASGDNVTATLDGNTLIISGKGAMCDYKCINEWHDDRPWTEIDNKFVGLQELWWDQGARNIYCRLWNQQTTPINYIAI